jgi:hypothetical protein
MLFSFALGGIDAARLAVLEDALRPLFQGLRHAGQRVISFAHGLAAPPAINMLVEHDGADIGRRLGEGRQEVAAARISLVCAEDVDGAAVNAARWSTLCEVAAAADFVWTLSPTAAFDCIVAADRLAAVAYGFDPVMLGRRLVRAPAQRDAGLVVYGPRTAYRQQLAERLRAAGLAPFVVEHGRFPDYIVRDLLSRARLIVVSRDSEAERAPAPARLAKALCSGAAVLAEAPASGSSPLERYVTVCPADAIPAACRELLAQEGIVEAGLARLDRFRAETSMTDGVVAALRLPAVAAMRDA